MQIKPFLGEEIGRGKSGFYCIRLAQNERSVRLRICRMMWITQDGCAVYQKPSLEINLNWETNYRLSEANTSLSVWLPGELLSDSVKLGLLITMFNHGDNLAIKITHLLIGQSNLCSIYKIVIGEIHTQLLQTTRLEWSDFVVTTQSMTTYLNSTYKKHAFQARISDVNSTKYRLLTKSTFSRKNSLEISKT